MCCNCTVTHGFGCVHSITPNLFICSPCDNDACLSATISHFPLSPFCALFKGIIIMPVHCLHISLSPWTHCCLIWRKCLCVKIWLGISSEVCSNDPCREVLQEQIWRRYPVNKEPAETSCEQHRAEMCDFKQGPPVPDSLWSANHFFLLLFKAKERMWWSTLLQNIAQFMFLLWCYCQTGKSTQKPRNNVFPGILMWSAQL